MVLAVGLHLSLRALWEAQACRTRLEPLPGNTLNKNASTVQMENMKVRNNHTTCAVGPASK